MAREMRLVQEGLPAKLTDVISFLRMSSDVSLHFTAGAGFELASERTGHRFPEMDSSVHG